MKRIKFKEIIMQVPELNHVQRVELRDELDNSDDLKIVCDLLEKRLEEEPFCPHCHSSNFKKHGLRNELIRYQCRDCGKTFNALTGTPLAGLRKKELWLKYSKCLLESTTIREAAKILNISKITSFIWRHRMLKTSQGSEEQVLYGVVEADETFFLESMKGNRNLGRSARKRGGKASKRGVSKEQVSVLVACDRNGHEADFITGCGAVSSSWLEKNFTHHLDPEALLITDSAKSFGCFCRQKGVEHISINVSKGERSKGIYHIQHVNSYHSTLKRWMMRFCGVATKYLNHYLGWCNELHSRKVSTPQNLLKLALE